MCIPQDEGKGEERGCVADIEVEREEAGKVQLELASVISIRDDKGGDTVVFGSVE